LNVANYSNNKRINHLKSEARVLSGNCFYPLFPTTVLVISDAFLSMGAGVGLTTGLAAGVGA
jgi:hypothetical protein